MTLAKLYEAVDRMGLFFPPHPGDEGAFAGGVVASNASRTADPTALELMRRLKRALDLDSILNPGKVLGWGVQEVGERTMRVPMKSSAQATVAAARKAPAP